MRIIFMGTPQFSVMPLNSLVDAGHEILLVVTQPDKINNRGNKIVFTPVKQRAMELNIVTIQPEKIRENIEFFNQVKEMAPDFIIVSAYGKILPKEILNIPQYGCLNIHASLLPKYRGAAPIQWSIINGDEFTGVSIMKMAEGLDTGPVYSMEKTIIDSKNVVELFDELSKIGSKLLVDTIRRISEDNILPIAQNADEATYAPMIHKEDGHLDLSKSPIELVRLIRGINPWVKTFVIYRNEKLIISEAIALDEENFKPAGCITDISKEGIKVSCGGSTLLITRLQFPGKREMKISEYLVGNSFDIEEAFNKREDD